MNLFVGVKFSDTTIFLFRQRPQRFLARQELQDQAGMFQEQEQVLWPKLPRFYSASDRGNRRSTVSTVSSKEEQC
jgi:hypothetical protein